MGSKMELAGVLKGWIYLGVSVTALLLLLWQFERRHPAATPVSKEADSTVAASTTPVFPYDDGADDSTVADSDTIPQDPSPVDPGGDAPAPQPASNNEAPLPSPADPGEVRKAPLNEEEGSSPAPTHQGIGYDVPYLRGDVDPPRPPTERNEDRVLENDLALTEAAPAVTMASSSVEVETGVFEAIDESSCPLIPDVSAVAGKYNQDDLHQGLTLSKPITVHAQAAGTVVKRSVNPITGTTLYILAPDGKLCLVYGGFSSLTEGMDKDAVISQCAELGTAEKRLIFQKLTVPAGQPWWKGSVAQGH